MLSYITEILDKYTKNKKNLKKPYTVKSHIII